MEGNTKNFVVLWPKRNFEIYFKEISNDLR